MIKLLSLTLLFLTLSVSPVEGLKNNTTKLVSLTLKETEKIVKQKGSQNY